MKLIFENWRKYLNEEQRPTHASDPRIFYNSGGIVCYDQESGGAYCGSIDLNKPPVTQSFDTSSAQPVARGRRGPIQDPAREHPHETRMHGDVDPDRVHRAKERQDLKRHGIWDETQDEKARKFRYSDDKCRDKWLARMEWWIRLWPDIKNATKRRIQDYMTDNPESTLPSQYLVNLMSVDTELIKMKRDYRLVNNLSLIHI